MRSAILGFLVLLVANLCRAQRLSCNQVTAISMMAESKSSQSLVSWKKKAGDSYVARLVYSFRSSELDPTGEQAASKLFSMIPPSKEVQPLWFTLDGFLCEGEQVKEIKTLAELHARMPHDIAKAVLVVPEKLRDYISYAYDSVQDPHSDYAVQMRLVCREKHKAFVIAVNSLAPNDRRWFVTKIFDPNACQAIAVPEAD